MQINANAQNGGKKKATEKKPRPKICHEMKINLSYFRTNFNEFWHGSAGDVLVSFWLIPAECEIEKLDAYFQEVAHTQHRPLYTPTIC